MPADITTYTDGNDAPVYDIAGSFILNKINALKNHLLQAKDVASNPTTVVDNADDMQSVGPQVPKFGTPEREKWRAQDDLRTQPIIGGM